MYPIFDKFFWTVVLALLNLFSTLVFWYIQQYLLALVFAVITGYWVYTGWKYYNR